MKALTIIKNYRERGQKRAGGLDLDEAIAELEALQSRSCDGCKYGKYGADSRGIEVECTLIWHCARGNGFPDRYEPKEK